MTNSSYTKNETDRKERKNRSLFGGYGFCIFAGDTTLIVTTPMKGFAMKNYFINRWNQEMDFYRNHPYITAALIVLPIGAYIGLLWYEHKLEREFHEMLDEVYEEEDANH